MGDWSAEGAALGPLGIDVDPLVITGGVGELVDLFLGDLVPRAVANVLADVVGEVVQGDGDSYLNQILS
jgi:hypothetical protein